MTSIRPSTSGVYRNRSPWRESEVLQNAVTLPEHFMAHGYRAIGSGKIYHGQWPETAPWFDYKTWGAMIYCGRETPMLNPRCPKPPPEELPLNRCKEISGPHPFDWGPYASNEEMGDWKLASWAIDQLQSDHRGPFFLACGFSRPHLPWYVPKMYFKMYEPADEIRLPSFNEMDLNDVPPIGRRFALSNGLHKRIVGSCNLWKEAVQAYLACISFVDVCVGRVIKALDRSRYSQNTIIVLWSDHGFHLGEKKHWRKYTLWEEATRVPLIFAGPGVSRGRCNAPVNLIDIYPTLIELCGLTPVKNPDRTSLEGTSLKSLLENPNLRWHRPTLTTYGRNNHAIRSEHWRYIRYWDKTEELYDHRNDLFERNNLARNPRFASIKHKLAQWLPKTNAKEILQVRCDYPFREKT